MSHWLDHPVTITREVECPCCGAKILDSDNRCPDPECESNREDDEE